ncbi:hypothetical protein JOM56_013789 [Amanita muscaria]
MPPTPVKRDSLASTSRHLPLTVQAIPPLTPRPSSCGPLPTSDVEIRTLAQVSKVFEQRLSHIDRARALYAAFLSLASTLEQSPEYPALMSQIATDLREKGFNPPTPCTLPHAQPCTLSHDPVTVTVTKEVHPASCSTEIRNLRKEMFNLKSGINSLYHSANLTHTANTANTPAPSLSDLDSSSGSTHDSNNSSYEPSTCPTPVPVRLPLPTSPIAPLSKSYANAAKTATTKSPKEIIRDRIAKSCTNKGTPSNVLVLSDFKSANTASSYKCIAEMRQKVNDILVDNKCKTISWSLKGNLVMKCAKRISEGDKTAIINAATATFKNDPTVLNKPTLSFIKFIDVPLFDIEGSPFDTNDFNAMVQQNDKWANVDITHGPTIIVKKNSTDAKKATMKIGFKDDVNSSIARRLLKTTILFGGTPIRCKLLQPTYRQHYTKAKQMRTKFKSDTDVDIIPT